MTAPATTTRGSQGFRPSPALRRALLLVTVLMILLASFLPPVSGWGSARIARGVERAFLELLFPFHGISEEGRRSVFLIGLSPLEVGSARHLVLVRDRDTQVWVEGANAASLMNPPQGELAWSVRHRLWLGGAPGETGPSVRVGRMTFFDRALSPREVESLAKTPPHGQLPSGLDPFLQIRPCGVPGASTADASASRATLTLRLPGNARCDGEALSLVGTPAVSAEALEELLSSIRRRQAFSVEIWIEPLAAPDRRRALLALAGDGKETNLRIDLGRSEMEVRVRAAYASIPRVLDFLLNLAAYAPLGVFIGWGRGRWSVVGLACIACTGLSLAVETAQLFSPDRVASLFDLAANGLGGTLGAVLVVAIRPGGRAASRAQGPAVS